jgi:hypothetical protein
MPYVDPLILKRDQEEKARSEASRIYKKLNRNGGYDATAYEADQNTGKSTSDRRRRSEVGLDQMYRQVKATRDRITKPISDSRRRNMVSRAIGRII